MDRLKEFIEVLSDAEVQQRTASARSGQTCKMCGQPADEFLSAAAEFEYLVSTICQSCQDYYLYNV